MRLHRRRWFGILLTLALMLGMSMTALAEPANEDVSDIETPLTLEVIESGTIVVKNPKMNMQYSINGNPKTAVSTSDDITINVSKDDRVQFFGHGTDIKAYSERDKSGTLISGGNAKCYIYGNIMSLVNENGFSDAKVLEADYAFKELFKDNTTLYNHSTKKLVLPATTLTEFCYNNMFSNCQNLTEAPELPAREMKKQCYSCMFKNCKKLTAAPSLDATELENNCYREMFYNCISLKTAPRLDAIILAPYCYEGMFMSCLNLTEAPVLPAPTLVNQCYHNMFLKCLNLNTVTCLATNCEDDSNTKAWLQAVAKDGTFFKASGVTWTQGEDGIPNDWTIKDYVAVTNVTLKQNDAVVTAINLDVNTAASLTASIEPAAPTDKTVIWSVDNRNVVLYSDPNCTAGTEVGTEATSTLTVYAKGVSAGTATVTCTSNADSTKTASCQVTVLSTYTVTVAEGIQNGTVTANPAVGKSGTTVTLTALPSAGYALEDISAVKTPETVAGILEAIGTASFTNDIDGTIKVEGNALVWDSNEILAGTAALTKTAAGYRATGTQFHCDFAVDSDSRIRDIALTSATDETSITVHFTGVSQNSLAVSLTPGEGGVYTFNMPRSNVAVNAAFAQPHIHGEGQDAVTFQPWGSADSLPTEAGSWYLTKDVILPDRWLVPGGGVNLCLNGKKIRVNEGRDKVIAVSAGTTLDLYDCGGNGQIIGGPGITGVSVEGTFNMHAGAITGCSWGVHNSGVFAMGGGSITGNSTGVYNLKPDGQPFSFTLSGAPIISGNEVTKGEKTYTTNVYLSENCVATIAGALEETAAIGITMDKPGVFTASADPVRASDYIARFTSDDSGYTVASDGDQLSLIQTPIEYLAWDEAQQKLVRQTGDKACRAYTVVTEEIPGLGMATEETWYVVSESVELEDRVPVYGTVNLILCDGVTLNAEKGITTTGATLNIYAQSEGKAMGALIAGNDGNNTAAIGGGDQAAGGTVTINGGNVNAIGGANAAGIGGGSGSDGGTVTINGGNVDAIGGANAAGIGAGNGSGANGDLYVAASHVVYSHTGAITGDNKPEVEALAQGQGGSKLEISRNRYMRVEPGQALERYDIWVDGVRVNAQNRDNVLGDGKVSCTPATQGDNPTPAVLRLNGATITRGHAFNDGFTTGTAAIFARGDLIIDVAADSSANAPNSTNLSYGVYVEGSLTVRGDGRLTATGGEGGQGSYGIYTNNVTVDGTVIARSGPSTGSVGSRCVFALYTATVNGVLTATAGEATGGLSFGIMTQADDITVNGTLNATAGTAKQASAGVYIESGALIVNSGASVTASGNTAAIDCNVRNAIAGTGWDNTTPSGDGVDIAINTEQDGQRLNYKKVLFPVFVKYPVWVGSVRVNALNKDDVLGDGNVAFTPATQGDEPTPAILTLNGATIVNGHAFGAGSDSGVAAIYAECDLIIDVAADSSATAPDSPNIRHGVHVEGSLTVRGDGKLTATGGQTGKRSCGIYADNAVTVDGVLTATAGEASSESYGINVQNDGSVTVSVDTNLTASGNTRAINGKVRNAIAGTGWTDVEGTQDETGIPIDSTGAGQSLTYKKVIFVPHVHSFTYSADGATITATCGAEDCTLTESTTTLTVVAPTLKTYGQTGDGISQSATLSDTLDDFNEQTGLSVLAADIKYYNATRNAQGVYTRGEEITTGAPTGAGDYMAVLELANVKTGPSATGTVTAFVGYTIAKGTPSITTAPTAGDITFGQTLANSTLTGGVASVEGSFAWDDDTVAPAATDSNATEYDVVFTPKDNDNYTAATCRVKLTVNKADPTATAPTGTATYGQTLADVALTNPEGNTPGAWAWAVDTATSVGNAGTNPFKASFTPTDKANYNSVTDVDVAVTVSRATPTVTAPTAKTLTWTGQPLELVTAGSTDGGELQYSLDGTNYSTAIPTGTEVGTYTVYFKVVGGANYTDVAAAHFDVVVKTADAGNAKPGTVDKLTYTGEAQALVTGGSVTGGELQYAIGTDPSTAPALDSFKPEVPTGTNAGTYCVWYRVKGDANHNDVAPACIEVRIAKAPIQPAVTITGWTYGQSANAPSVTGNAGNGAVTYTYSDKADGAFAATVPVNAGTWYVKAAVAETDNYLGGEATLSFAIGKATVTVAAVSVTKVEGDIDPQLTYRVVSGLVSGDTLTGSLTRQTGEAVGDYTITQGTLTAGDNYVLVFSDGILTITAKPQGGDIETEVETGEGVPKIWVEGLTDELVRSLFTSEELARMKVGEKLRVYLEATSIKGSVSVAEKQLIAGLLPTGAKVVYYMNLSMFRGIGGNAPIPVYRLDPAKVTLHFQIPEDVAPPKNVKRTFYCVRVHENDARIIGRSKGLSLSAKTDMFSTYAIAYADQVAPTAKPTVTPKPTAKPTKAPRPTVTPKPTAKPTKKPRPTKQPKPTVTPKPTKQPVQPDFTMLAKLSVCGDDGKTLKASWTRVKEARGYDIYFERCGNAFEKQMATVTGTNSAVFYGLKRHTEYKAYVRAWKWVNGRKSYIGKPSPEAHSITGGYNSRSCNAKSISLSRSRLTLKVGKSRTVRANVKGVKSGRKLLQHVKLVRWYSSNVNVATVNRNGKVKAVGTGSCTIYAIANNGVRSSVKVTVK